MVVERNFPLDQLNTFGVKANASCFVEINREPDLISLFHSRGLAEMPRLVLGSGSNMLFTKDYEGLLIRMNIKGIREEINGSDIVITAGAGEVWNDLVNYCVDREYAGIENLSLIPGTVGASPVQNIGAYGVELMDVFHSCRAFEIGRGKIVEFDNAACRFSYRDSVFKSELKNQYIITDVSYKLSRRFVPKITYGAIQTELIQRGIHSPTIKNVSEVVSAIRVSKLPDPATIGNAGSFFKNPIIPVDKFVQLQSNFPDIINFNAGTGFVKLAAGWLIEQCGWKGRIIGNTGTWKNQALVIVNHGGATGEEIFQFSQAIIESVKNKFGIKLEREVNVI